MPRRYKIYQLSAKAIASYAEEKENGYDIADYLIKEKSGEAILQSMCQKNPSLKKMIALLNLELVDFHFESK